MKQLGPAHPGQVSSGHEAFWQFISLNVETDTSLKYQLNG